jgi:hypothetical protein
MTESTHKPEAPSPCPEREDALALHAGRDLPAQEARELEAHLTRCSGCRAFLHEVEESRSAFAALAAEPLPTAGPAEVHRRVMDAVRTGRADGGAKQPSATGTRRRWAIAAAVVLALGAALAWRLGPGARTESPGSPGDRRVWVARSEPPASPSSPRGVDTHVPDAPIPDTPPRGAGERSPEPSVPEPTSLEPTSPEPKPREPEPTAPPPETEIRRASADDRPELKIQLVSDDPDIVIYWLVDMEEPTDAPDAPSTT